MYNLQSSAKSHAEWLHLNAHTLLLDQCALGVLRSSPLTIMHHGANRSTGKVLTEAAFRTASALPWNSCRICAPHAPRATLQRKQPADEYRLRVPITSFARSASCRSSACSAWCPATASRSFCNRKRRNVTMTAMWEVATDPFAGRKLHCLRFLRS